MTGSCEVLVLVAGEKSATLCANSDGHTRLLRPMNRALPGNGSDEQLAGDARQAFACELMMALCRDTGAHAYDGVIIFAEAPMMEELRRIQTRAISRLMLAQIVGKPAQDSRFAGLGTVH